MLIQCNIVCQYKETLNVNLIIIAPYVNVCNITSYIIGTVILPINAIYYILTRINITYSYNATSYIPVQARLDDLGQAVWCLWGQFGMRALPYTLPSSNVTSYINVR